MSIPHMHCLGCQQLTVAIPCPKISMYPNGVPPCPACYLPPANPSVDRMINNLIDMAATTVDTSMEG